MTTVYPAQIDSSTTLPTVINNITPVTGDIVNNLRDAIVAIETELGIKPSGTFSTVRTRLDELSSNTLSISGDLGGTPSGPIVIGLQGRPVLNITPSTGQVLGWVGNAWAPISNNSFFAGGDLSGTGSSQVVIGLQNRPVSSIAPNIGEVLGWDGSVWRPKTDAGFTPGGDLSGTPTSQTVVGFQGNPVASGTPTTDQFLGWTGTEWFPQTIVSDQITQSYAITLVGPTLVEVSQNVNRPIFTATYNQTPITAVISDDQGNPSHDVISTPTSFFIDEGYRKDIYGQSVLFTLTSSNGTSTKTAFDTLTWGQRIYYGTGADGGSTAGFITSLQNNIITTSKSINFIVDPGSSEFIYFAYRSGYGTAIFTVNGWQGGFNFVSNSISLTNAFGFTENYTLYQSANPALGLTSIYVS